MKVNNLVCKISVALIVCCLVSACDKQEDTSPKTTSSTNVSSTTVAVKETLIFKNGFEGATNINTRGQFADILGYDDLSTPSDWEKDLFKKTPYFGHGQIYYEQGDDSQRKAEIVPDPENPSNKVLRFRIAEKHIRLDNGDYKARIQYELHNTFLPPADGYIKEYYQKIRLYFSPDFKVLEDAGTEIGWIVMQEFWDDPQFIVPGYSHVNQMARVHISVQRNQSKVGERLRFGIQCESPALTWPFAWTVDNTTFAIPLGKWMTEEIYLKEGDANNGRFYFAVTIDGVKTVICDKKGITTSKVSGYIPDGQTSWDPMKLYCAQGPINLFKEKNKFMDVYWDDLEIWLNKKP